MRLSALLLLALPISISAREHGAPGGLPNKTFISSVVVEPRLKIIHAHPRPQRGLFTFTGMQGQSPQGSGPLIFDSRGRMVWRSTKWPNAHNLQVQEYKGARYLTFWSGPSSADASGHARGYYYMLDSSYREKLRVSATSGLFGDWGDKNEFRVTKAGTALMTVYERLKVDLSSVSKHRGRDGWVWDCVFQEVDIESRKVIFRWRALDAFALNHSATAPVGNQGSYEVPWDWFHLNSVDKNDAGNYLISARHANAISCISGRDGSVMWNLGGKQKDLAIMSESQGRTSFRLPSDARWHNNDTVSLFDAGAAPESGKSQTAARGLLLSLNLDSSSKQAHLRGCFEHPYEVYGNAQGSMQILENGNSVVGWGLAGSWTEFTANGSEVEHVEYQARNDLHSESIQSHPTYKMRWKGMPTTKPSLVIRRSSAFVSWNGATEIHHWRLQCTHSDWFRKEHDWMDVVSEERQGFETVLDFDQAHLKKWVRVLALDSDGNTLGVTRIVDWRFARRPLPQAYSISDRASLIWIGSGAFVLLIIVLRISRRCIRRIYILKSSKRRGSNGLMYKSLPTASPK